MISDLVETEEEAVQSACYRILHVHLRYLDYNGLGPFLVRRLIEWPDNRPTVRALRASDLRRESIKGQTTVGFYTYKIENSTWGDMNYDHSWSTYAIPTAPIDVQLKTDIKYVK
jgi:hypothetical protein